MNSMKNCGREIKSIEFVGYFIFSYYLCRIYWSLKHCRIKKGKETRSFLIRSPFDTYPSQTSKNQDFTIREMILCGNIAKKSNLKTRCLKRVRTNNIVVIRTE